MCISINIIEYAHLRGFMSSLFHCDIFYFIVVLLDVIKALIIDFSTSINPLQRTTLVTIHLLQLSNFKANTSESFQIIEQKCLFGAICIVMSIFGSSLRISLFRKIYSYRVIKVRYIYLSFTLLVIVL